MRKLFNRIKLAFKYANSFVNFFNLLKKTDKEIEQMYCDHHFTKCVIVKGGYMEKTCGKCGVIIRIPIHRKKKD